MRTSRPLPGRGASSSTTRRVSRSKSQAVLFRASHHTDSARSRADPSQHPVREIRRIEVSRSGPREGRARGAALCGKSARPRGGLPRCTQLVPGIGPGNAASFWTGVTARGRPRVGAYTRRGRLRRVARVCERFDTLFARVAGGRPNWSRPVAGTRRISSGGMTTRPRAKADLAQLAQIAASYPTRERF